MKTIISILAIVVYCNCIPSYKITQELKVDCNERWLLTQVWQKNPTKLLAFNSVVEGYECDYHSATFWKTKIINDSVKHAQYALAKRIIEKTKQALPQTKQP